ncbi:MAG: helix-turn-helix domain-containing protein [Okeania sp. SIO3B5]|uniref:helix-turn-helix domain-containing protein n=1 Tax=Okeania sp. SIO3B5 TaxID=2607811 RepID=UPI0013FF025A|nr:helix-turn-helix transcriptional regulator [Okeania sp. SIO3B5]NEO51743.1 helix-turn-helix domain-containing protein [Okeania sp. SIO3B5]
MKYNFQEWLKTDISDEPEVILAGKLEYLRLYLTDAMRSLREKAGLTQAQLAEKLGVQQAAVSKLESSLKDHKLESVLDYLHRLNADLLIAVKQEDELIQVSDNDGMILIDLPEEIEDLAEVEKMSLREYILAAIQHFSQKKVSVREFIESDDEVAVKVRMKLANKSLSEIASELEKMCQIYDEDDRLFAVKKLLAGGVSVGSNNRDISDKNEDDGIELLELAEELLEKLENIFEEQE